MYQLLSFFENNEFSGSGFLIMSALDAFYHNAISFVVESSYRDWTTNFPSVVVCESKNNDKIQGVADK